MTPTAGSKRGIDKIDEDDSEKRPKKTKISKKPPVPNQHAAAKRRQIHEHNRKLNLEEEETSSDNPGSHPAMTKSFPPLIITHELKNPRTFYEVVKKWAAKVHFRIRNGRHELITYLKEDHDTIQKNLLEAQISFYTYTPKSEKPKRVVLKGLLAGVFTEDEILDDLKQQTADVIKVTQMKSKKKGAEAPLNMYLVSFAPTASIGRITKSIQFCCDHKIFWENYVMPRTGRGTQCWNCQQWGHHSRFCGQKRACLRCGGSCERGTCPKSPEAPPSCANCQENHPSNYRGCRIAKEYLNRIQIKTPPAPKNDNKKTDQTQGKPQSFADAVKSNKKAIVMNRNTSSKHVTVKQDTQHKNNKTQAAELVVCDTEPMITEEPQSITTVANPPGWQRVDNVTSFKDEVQKIFNLSLVEILRKINDFMPEYRSISDPEEKRISMLSFLLSFPNVQDGK